MFVEGAVFTFGTIMRDKVKHPSLVPTVQHSICIALGLTE